MQSFGRLKELPVDLIKIDGSFIRNVTQRGKDHAMVEATVVVARAFGAKTVAEYVEDEATLRCLRELGVDWVQGYLIGRPVPIGRGKSRRRRHALARALLRRAPRPVPRLRR